MILIGEWENFITKIFSLMNQFYPKISNSFHSTLAWTSGKIIPQKDQIRTLLKNQPTNHIESNKKIAWNQAKKWSNPTTETFEPNHKINKWKGNNYNWHQSTQPKLKKDYCTLQFVSCSKKYWTWPKESLPKK